MSQGELPEESMGYVEDATADKAWDACKQDIVAVGRLRVDTRHHDGGAVGRCRRYRYECSGRQAPLRHALRLDYAPN